MRLPVSSARLIQGRSDDFDRNDLANAMRELLNGRGDYYRQITTTDATVTNAWDDELPANGVALVWGEFVGVTADGVDAGGYVRKGVFRRPGAGAVVTVGAGVDVIGTDLETAAGWDAGFALDAAVPGNVFAYVQGAAATTITWRVNIRALVLPWL